MKEHPTPETDAFSGGMLDWIKFAQKLERERDEAREKYFAMRDLSNNATELAEKYRRERAEAQEDLTELCARYNKLLGIEEAAK